MLSQEKVKFDNRNTRKRWGICSKITVKIAERRPQTHSAQHQRTSIIPRITWLNPFHATVSFHTP